MWVHTKESRLVTTTFSAYDPPHCYNEGEPVVVVVVAAAAATAAA